MTIQSSHQADIPWLNIQYIKYYSNKLEAAIKYQINQEQLIYQGNTI